MLGVQWATKYFKGTNGKDGELKAREMGSLTSDIKYLTCAVEELKRAANENQHRIGELAGNVNTLTNLITKHYKL